MDKLDEFFKFIRKRRSKEKEDKNKNPGERWTHFKPGEVKGLDPNFVDLLDRARDISDTPYIISSGFRTEQHNQSVGGVSNSSHTKGVGVDLKCKDSSTRFAIVRGLLAVGINRIGVYEDGHVHCDVSRNHPQYVMWLGKY